MLKQTSSIGQKLVIAGYLAHLVINSSIGQHLAVNSSIGQNLAIARSFAYLVASSIGQKLMIARYLA